MDRLYRPEHIAVAGAGSAGSMADQEIVRRLLADYPGRVFPIHPDEPEVFGIAAFPSPAALPKAVDLLISLLPGERLLPLVEDCPPDRIRYLLPLSTPQTGPANAPWPNRDAIEAAARERGIQVIDPAQLRGDHRTMEALFSPRSIALAGASNSDGKIGNLIMRRLLADYRGRVAPIHPREQQILGVTAYPKPSALPVPVDLLIALLPGDQLLPLIEDCSPGRIKYLLAIPSGFGEVPGPGREQQQAIVAAASERGIRVVGPNCMGLVNAAIGLNASLVPDMPPGGAGLSLLTQSGGYGIATTLYALDHQLPIAKICDLGNTSDVQASDVMDYFEADPDTVVAGLLLESVGQPGEFLARLTELAAAKPTVVTLLGRTAAGSRASEAHLGLKPVQGLLDEVRRSGAIYAETCRDLHNAAKGLCWQPLPPGPRLGIVTGTGGVGAEIADLASESGLEVPPLSAATQAALSPLLPPYAGRGNPVDLTPIWWQYPDVYPEVIRLLAADENIDQLIVTITDVATGVDDLPLAIERLLADPSVSQASKPVYVFWGARDDMLANMRVLERARIPCYRTTSEIVRTVSAITGYALKRDFG